MIEEQYINTVIDALFIRGLTWSDQFKAEFFVGRDWHRLGSSTDLAVSIENLCAMPGLIYRDVDPEERIPSSTTGAAEEWIAIHEAAHAVVAVKAGMMIWGIRFFGDGQRSQTKPVELPWQESTEELFRGHVRVDVAGNVAEMMRNHVPEGGHLNQFFPEGGPEIGGKYPTDAIGAWGHAMQLARFLFNMDGKEATETELQTSIRAIIKQAEDEARQILEQNSEALDTIARELRRGPMTGTDILAIIE